MATLTNHNKNVGKHKNEKTKRKPPKKPTTHTHTRGQNDKVRTSLCSFSLSLENTKSL
jgi:hypothetical protein